MTDDACWHNRFSPDRPRCQNKGKWIASSHSPIHLVIPTLARTMRWCDDHRHADDVPVSDAARKEGEG